MDMINIPLSSGIETDIKKIPKVDFLSDEQLLLLEEIIHFICEFSHYANDKLAVFTERSYNITPKYEVTRAFDISFLRDYSLRRTTNGLFWKLQSGRLVIDLGCLCKGLLVVTNPERNKFSVSMFDELPDLGFIAFLGILKMRFCETLPKGVVTKTSYPGFVREITSFYDNEDLHRDDGKPAYEEINLLPKTEEEKRIDLELRAGSTGFLFERRDIKKFYHHGKLHSYGVVPSQIIRTSKKQLYTWHDKGVLHNPYGYAYMEYKVIYAKVKPYKLKICYNGKVLTRVKLTKTESKTMSYLEDGTKIKITNDVDKAFLPKLPIYQKMRKARFGMSWFYDPFALKGYICLTKNYLKEPAGMIWSDGPVVYKELFSHPEYSYYVVDPEEEIEKIGPDSTRIKTTLSKEPDLTQDLYLGEYRVWHPKMGTEGFVVISITSEIRTFSVRTVREMEFTLNEFKEKLNSVR
jgi:hypothetical protein